MKAREWVGFLALSVVWGSSFLWIKIAVQEIGPFTLVAWRLLFGVLLAIPVMLVLKPELPRDREIWFRLAFLGVINSALPFVLISFGEQTIDSAVASVLNSTVPLFTMILAHFFLQDDRMNLTRIIGLLIGFLGVVLLVGRDLNASGFQGRLLGHAAVISAAFLYAVSGIFARRYFSRVSHVIQAFAPLFVADGVVWISALAWESPLVLPAKSITWIALMWMGFLGSSAAYLIFYWLLTSIGPTRVSLVTYTIALVGVVLGVVFLGEQLDIRLAAGAVLVVIGVGVVNKGGGALWEKKTAEPQIYHSVDEEVIPGHPSTPLD